MVIAMDFYILRATCCPTASKAIHSAFTGEKYCFQSLWSRFCTAAEKFLKTFLVSVPHQEHEKKIKTFLGLEMILGLH